MFMIDMKFLYGMYIHGIIEGLGTKFDNQLQDVMKSTKANLRV